ncbi:hypothetical protein DRW03_35465 [Corallococcus sp. H22C18031201]|nr:hypothetical protein DRW03_35465 [Corallococcus sp. H22C18031201]
MSVTLTNALGRLLTFLLSHEAYCLACGECACSLQPGRGGRRLPASLTLAAGVSLAGLPEAVLQVASVAAAVRRGDVAVKRQVAQEARAPVSSPALPAPSHSMPEAAARAPRKKRGAP